MCRNRDSLLLQPVTPKDKKQADPGLVRWITPFGAQWGSVCKILEKHWGILTNNKELANIVGDSPKMVARRIKNLGDILIHTENVRQPTTTWLSGYPRNKGMFPCTKCQICPFVDRTNVFMEAEGQKEFEIRLNCSTTSGTINHLSLPKNIHWQDEKNVESKNR